MSTSDWILVAVEGLIVVGFIALGVRTGGMGLGLWGGVGTLVLVFGFGLDPGEPPVDAMLIIIAVISAAVQAGQIWLAVVAVAFSLVGAFYYLRVVKLMYFDEPGAHVLTAGGGAARVLLSLNGLALLALGLLPQQLMLMCKAAVQSVF